MGLSGAMRCKLGNTGGFFTCTKKKMTIKVKPSVKGQVSTVSRHPRETPTYMKTMYPGKES